MVTPRKRVPAVTVPAGSLTCPQLTPEEKAIFKEIVKFEATTGKMWWTFAHPKETWMSFKKRGCPTTKVESTITKPFDVKKVAQDIRNHLEAAVGDVAHDMIQDCGGCADDNWTKKIKAAKKRKIQDIPGWLADELYNDPDTLQDLIGDKLYEECNGEKLKQLEVLAVLRGGHTALTQACDAIQAGL